MGIIDAAWTRKLLTGSSQPKGCQHEWVSEGDDIIDLPGQTIVGSRGTVVEMQPRRLVIRIDVCRLCGAEHRWEV